jgi:eukaryotic-like serine/threonine-protein kinase
LRSAATEELFLQHLGKYQLVRKLAVGGMAEVFLAKAAGPMGFEKTLVLKRILPNLAADPQFVQMFLGEAKLAASLNHPNIAQIFDFGQAEGAYFIAMEHVDGPNLRSISRRSAERFIPLPISVCAKIVSYACEALAYAHEFIDPSTATHLSVIHHDVSPENILLSRNGAVKVVDFGIAKAAGQTHQTKSGVLRGKISYMPPEQIQGKEVDHRADIFALGVVFYELMTGCKPFDARTDVTILQAILYEQMIPAAARRADIPESIARILQRALAKDPDARYPNCRHFQAELERFIVSTGEPVGAYQLANLVAQLSGSSTALSAATPPIGAGGRSATPPQKGTAAATPPQKGAAVATPPQKGAAAATPGAAMPPKAFPSAPMTPEVSDPAFKQPVNDFSGSAITEMAESKQKWAAMAGLLGGALILAAAGFALFHQGSEDLGPSAIVDDDHRVANGRENIAAASPGPDAVAANPELAAQPGPKEIPGAETTDDLASAERGTGKPPRREPGSRLASRTRVAKRSVVAAADARPQAATGASKSKDRPPGLASFAVESVPPGQIFVNGKLVGSSPVRVKSLAAGQVRVEVLNSAAGFSKQEVFTVDAGDNGTKRIVVESASLEFRIRPYATVFLDGKLLGQTPFPPVNVFEGKHSVRLVNADLNKEIAVDYLVKPGHANIFKYNLTQAEN